MKVFALIAAAQAIAISYDGHGYTTNKPVEQIGSRWGLKPTKTWIPGPGTAYDPRKTYNKKDQNDMFAKVVEEQRLQEKRFAVDSIHQNGDLAQVTDQTVWGLEPTQVWIPGPGGDEEQQKAEARQKKAFLARSVDSIIQSTNAQVGNKNSDDLAAFIIENGMTPIKY